MSAVSLQHISKSYNDVEALNQVSFEVEKGELFGVIGPDGAGKTSLFRILTTLILPDTGKATVMGYNVLKDYKKIRHKIGYMPGNFSLYQDLTVEENLTFFATIFGTSIDENYNIIRDVYQQIEPFKTRKAGKLSGGMKQKLALSCALIHKPSILFLDEPTTGVDAVSRKEFWDMLQSLKTQGITILVSTPYMDEALKCERIALMQNGSILKVNSPKNIIESFSEELYSVSGHKQYKLLQFLRKQPTVETAFVFGNEVHITVNKNIEKVQKQLRQVFKNIVVEKIKPTIEDSFIHLSLANQDN